MKRMSDEKFREHESHVGFDPKDEHAILREARRARASEKRLAAIVRSGGVACGHSDCGHSGCEVIRAALSEVEG